MKKVMIISALVILVIAGGSFWWHAQPKTPAAPSTRLNVVASFYPLMAFTQAVGGDFVNVTSATPAGVEPHDYEPTPQQVAAVESSDLLVFNGGGVDAWAEKLTPAHSVRMADVVLTLPGSEGEAVDPHFWLNPVLAAKEVNAIAQELALIDPAHATNYHQNADAYTAQLMTLDTDYRAGLRVCTQRSVITSHAAFAYLARQYDFQVSAISGMSPDDEPSAGRLADLAKLVQGESLKYVFFETLASPKLAQALASEAGAQTLVFNPLEGLTDADISAGKSYLSVMRDNLANLRTAMGCK